MFTLDQLKAIRTIVVHHNSPGNPCPDGTAAAIILHDALPNAQIVFARPSSEELELMPAEPGMLFCDLSPNPTRVKDFVKTETLVLDHHEKQKDVVAQFGEFGRYSDEKGVSGAVLAYQAVWQPLYESMPGIVHNQHPHWGKTSTVDRLSQVSSFAWIVGVRDTWQKDDQRWKAACQLAAAIRFYPWGYFANITDPFGRGFSALQELISIGPVLVDRQDEVLLNYVKNAFYFQRDDLKFAVVPTTETSDVADIIKADVLIGFKYIVENEFPKLVLSCRSRSGYDVGSFAQKNGGGGHKLAAGCTLYALAYKNPYEQIQDLVSAHTFGR